MRPCDGQWLYNTADGGDVGRAACTVLIGQSRAEAMDGQNSGTRTVTDRAKRYRSWAAPTCWLAWTGVGGWQID